MEHAPSRWLLNVLGQVSRASHPAATVDSVMSGITPSAELPGSDNGGRPTPEQLAFIQRLVLHLLEGRKLIGSYNVVLLGCLAVFTACHFIGVARDTRKQRELEPINSSETSGSEHSSSASSTLEGSTNSADSVTKAQPDIERQPLLGRRRQLRQPCTRPLQLLRGWLLYQPKPIPIIDKSLPSNETSLLILAFLGLNAFYQCYHIPTDPELLFIVADRAGLVFVANLPLLYLLAAKNQPVTKLTGYSYESLNILHRRVGELLCFEALVHGGCMVIWVLWTAPLWLRERFANFFNTWLVILGLAALAAYELLYFTSLGSFRQRWYELFLASHVFLQAFALAVLWLHQHNTRPFVGAALVIFVCDRLIWRLTLKSATLTADLSVLDDGETILVSADWDIPDTTIAEQNKPWTQKLLRRDHILRGWRPAEHVFISVPGLGRTHALQAHPFTIASAAPKELPLAATHTDELEAEVTATGLARHAWFSLLIRGRTGFTDDLLQHAQQGHTRVPVRLDGPYGSQRPLEMLRARGTSILVAGGSGIAVIFPLVWSLAAAATRRREGDSQGRRKIYLLWIVHSESQRSWVPRDRLDELSRLSVEITLPEPTESAGRPDVPRYIDELTATAGEDGEIGVVVSGPDGLNRSVRNACSVAVRRGRSVGLSVEKFGW